MKTHFPIALNEHLSHKTIPVKSKSHTGFEPLMDHFQEYKSTLAKYSIVPHKKQLLLHLIRRLEENSDFHNVNPKFASSNFI